MSGTASPDCRAAQTSAAGAAILGGGAITCRIAASAADLAAHYLIRHQVFVTEQRIFTGSDRDEHDTQPGVLHLLGRYGSAPAGAVRLFPLGGRMWQGDRLCVLPPYRAHGLGAPLVRCAVATAGARGGTQMIAYIQPPNMRFFLHLGWRLAGDSELYAGRPHQPMIIDLPTAAGGAVVQRELGQGVRR